MKTKNNNKVIEPKKKKSHVVGITQSYSGVKHGSTCSDMITIKNMDIYGELFVTNMTLYDGNIFILSENK